VVIGKDSGVSFGRGGGYDCRDQQFWKAHIKEYMSFPNPINTALPHVGSIWRLHMVMQAQASPGHVIRCVCGTALRLVVWVSLANVAFAATGRAQGFWAAKVGHPLTAKQ